MVFSKSDWLELGLKTLVDDGPSAIRIDGLCAYAGRTKGSFYHHFKDRNAYVADLMTYWEQTLVQQVNAKTARMNSPQERISAVTKVNSGRDANLERALRRWAGTEPIVEAGVARVDKRRVDYLARLWQDAKDITSQEAIDLAVMDVAIMVGFQQLYVQVTHERRKRIDDLMDRMKDREG